MVDHYQQPRRNSVHIIKEVDGLSKDSVELTGGEFVPGEVISMNAMGVYTKLDIAADATEANEAKGVISNNYDATTETVTALVNTRLTAMRGDYLVWPENTTAALKSTFIEQLAALNIIVR